jgi:hypothetical protein
MRAGFEGGGMSWARRPEDETPRMETRTFVDDAGRHWAGSVISGRFSGGEAHAEIVFVCEDVPSETKRFVRLDSPPVEASEEWRTMDERRILQLFRDSEPA